MPSRDHNYKTLFAITISKSKNERILVLNLHQTFRFALLVLKKYYHFGANSYSKKVFNYWS